MKDVRSKLCIGYTFMFKGSHCTVTSLRPTYFTYKVSDIPREGFGNNYMHYWFFKTTNHYKSRYLNKRKVGISK
jgi:hypothetical protein